MNREELIKFLKENLSIRLEKDRDYYGNNITITVYLSLGKEQIDSDHISVYEADRKAW